MKKVLFDKKNVSEEDLNEIKDKYEVVRDDGDELVVLTEDSEKLVSTHGGLIEMNE